MQAIHKFEAAVTGLTVGDLRQLLALAEAEGFDDTSQVMVWGERGTPSRVAITKDVGQPEPEVEMIRHHPSCPGFSHRHGRNCHPDCLCGAGLRR